MFRPYLPNLSQLTASQSMQYLVHIYNFEIALHAQREPRQSVSKANQGRLGESWKKFFLHALHSMLYPHVNKAATGAELKTLLKPRPYAFLQSYHCTRAGVCCGPCNPSKWEADIWGWLKVRRSAMLHYTVTSVHTGHSGRTRGWLGVERCQLCLQVTSHSAKWHRWAAVGHWISLCVCAVL